MIIKFILALAFPLFLVIGSWFTPWSRPRATVTVTGEAGRPVANRVAWFTVNITQTDKDKETAVNAVNQAMEAVISAVRDFGIDEKDLTTQNVSVSEISRPEILIYPPRPDTGEKQWQAGNSLTVVLREVSRASALTDLLQGFPLAQVSGPDFSLDSTDTAGAELLSAAVEAAREKAAAVAAASKRKLGKVITVSESGGYYPLYRGMEAAVKDVSVPVPVEPGSTEINKTVTVVFELR